MDQKVVRLSKKMAGDTRQWRRTIDDGTAQVRKTEDCIDLLSQHFAQRQTIICFLIHYDKQVFMSEETR